MRQNPRDKTTTERKEVRLGGKKYDQKGQRCDREATSTTGREKYDGERKRKKNCTEKGQKRTYRGTKRNTQGCKRKI